MRAAQPSNLGDTSGLSNCFPLFVWQACPHVLAVNSGFLANSGFSSFWMEGMKPPPLCAVRVPLLLGGGILHQGVEQYHHFS